MPFIVQPFVLKLQTRLDKDASVFTEGVEGDIPAGIPIPGQLVEKPAPLPPIKWATVWSEATAIGAAGIIPASLTIPLAQTAMFGVLMGATSAAPPHSILKAGFAAFALAMVPGHLPVAQTTPPGGTPDFDMLDGVGNGSTTNAPWLQACGFMLQSWFMKGNAYYLPNGPMLKWL